MRQKIEKHLRRCHRCTVVYDSTRKMLVITGDERVFEVPAGFSERLHTVLDKAVSGSNSQQVGVIALEIFEYCTQIVDLVRASLHSERVH